MSNDHLEHLAQFKAALQTQGLDAFLITDAVHCFYLSGFTGTNGWLLITAAQEQDYLVTDFRYQEQAAEQVTGLRIELQGASAVTTISELAQQCGLKTIGLDQEKVTLAVYAQLKEAMPQVTLLPSANPATEIRKRKNSQELQFIKKAVEIADKAFLHLLDYVRPGLSEKEIALELEFFMRRLGGTKNAFETIVASGERSALPHGVASNRILQDGDLVLLDFGTVYQGYHSDLTRTLYIGEPDGKAREIYQLVLRAQEAVLAQIQPGMKANELDAIARKMIAEAGYGAEFGHGLGHGVGLEIHEKPSLSPRDETVLEPGMVVTVEPGIYLPRWGGIRIEDMVVITPGGCEILTKSPKVLQLHN
ncbi:MAG: M24 family metallopeptidase [Peptococcia bacterium]